MRCTDTDASQSFDPGGFGTNIRRLRQRIFWQLMVDDSVQKAEILPRPSSPNFLACFIANKLNQFMTHLPSRPLILFEPGPQATSHQPAGRFRQVVKIATIRPVRGSSSDSSGEFQFNRGMA